jgi:hypothetical protein
MAPKIRKAAGTANPAGATYKDARVPDPALATEEYAAVSLYRCSTVEAIWDHPRFPVPPPCPKNTPITHALPLLARLVPDKGPSPSMIDSFVGPSFFAIL